MSKTIAIKEVSKIGTRFAYPAPNINPPLRKNGNENDASTSNNYRISKSITSITKDGKSVRFPEDKLTHNYLINVCKPIFKNIIKYAIDSYRIVIGDSTFFKERIESVRKCCFAFNSETDVDKVCSLASEYIRHFEFGIGDDITARETASILNEFAERYFYTYENISSVIDAFRETIILGLSWLHVKYDAETTSFSIEVVLPMSIMFSNTGKLSYNNIDWIVHEDIYDSQSILNILCTSQYPLEDEDDLYSDENKKPKKSKVQSQVEKAMSSVWDGTLVTPMDYISNRDNNVKINDVTCEINKNGHFPLLYKYKRFFDNDTRKFFYTKRVFVNNKEIEALTENVDYIPYIPFILKDAYAYSKHAPHRRFQSIIARAESEIMINGMLMSSIASKCANDISGLILVDESILPDKSENVKSLKERSILKVNNPDPNKNLRDSFITLEGSNPNTPEIQNIEKLHPMISAKLFSIVNKDSLFKSGVHYTSVANHQIKVASTTLSILDTVMIGLHAIVKRVIKQTLIDNPSVVFTPEAVKRIRKARKDKKQENDKSADDALFGLSVRQMANYALSIIDSLHFVATESAADGSKKKADIMKLYELNTASGEMNIDILDIIDFMNLGIGIRESIKRKARDKAEVQAMQLELQKAQILANIELEKAKAAEQRAKALEHEMKARQLNAEASNQGDMKTNQHNNVKKQTKSK